MAIRMLVWIGMILLMSGAAIWTLKMSSQFVCAVISGLGCFCLLWAAAFGSYQRESWQKAAKMGRKLLIALTLLFLVTFLFIEGLIINASNGDNYEGNCLVVLGAGLYGDTPSPALAARLERAVVYLEQNPQAVAILSGGQGMGETITEAEGMRRYLLQKGIGQERLYLEEKSHNTRENLYFSREIVLSLGYAADEIGVVSNGFHLYRAKSLANTLGMSVKGVAAPLPDILGLDMVCYFREYFAVLKMYAQNVTGFGLDRLTLSW